MLFILFSHYLLESIQKALNNKEQIILFQNRRGYSPTVTCEVCNWIPKCTRCDISLTLHQYKNEVNCHYCGYKQHSPHKCPACGSTHIVSVGFGTEKIEEELNIYFPDAAIDRMDLDTTRGKYGYEKIISSFQAQEIDVLVGTQIGAHDRRLPPQGKRHCLKGRGPSRICFNIIVVVVIITQNPVRRTRGKR